MDKRRIFFGVGLLSLFVALSTFANFSSFEDASWTKLWVLLGMIFAGSFGLSMVLNQQQVWLNTCRYFSGILFTFSGFVKAVDPLGSKYKFIDYFEAWGINDIFGPMALVLGIILSYAELLVGLALIFKIFPKWSSLGALIFMIVFVPITLYLAMQENISGKELVHDCGCFGDALILTNWQTFVKNLFILLPVVICFAFNGRFVINITPQRSLVVLAVFSGLIVGLSIFALRHLPPVDFRPYKVGVTLMNEKCNDISQSSNVKMYQYADFINSQTGEHKEFDIMNDYPTDPVWEYNPDVQIRIVTETLPSNEPDTLSQQGVYMVENLMFMNGDNDATCDIITDTSYVFMVIHYNLTHSNPVNQSAINTLHAWAMERGYAFYGATSSLNDDIEDYQKLTGASYQFLSADDILLKTIVRSNPGVVLLKNGKIIAKWHHNDVPLPEEIARMCK